MWEREDGVWQLGACWSEQPGLGLPGAGLAPTAPLNMHNFTESQPQTRPVWDPAGSRQNKTTPRSYMNTGKHEHCSNHKMTKHLPPMLALVSECYFSPSYSFGPPLGFLLWAPSSGLPPLGLEWGQYPVIGSPGFLTASNHQKSLASLYLPRNSLTQVQIP